MIRTGSMAAVAPIALAVALAGCSPSANAPANPSPGLWEVTQSATPLSGLPGGQPRSQTSKACLKSTDLNFTELSTQANGACTSSDVSKEPGKVHAKVVCNAGKPNASDATVNGTTTATTLHIEVVSTENLTPPGAAAPVAAKLKVVMDGKRVGECPAS
jgi:hypothetical protein